MDGSEPRQERTPENPRRFRIHRCLGRGGFGEVYRATMWREGGVASEVAVKVLAADVEPDSDSVRRLRDEGKLLGVLDHPAILKVYDLVLLAGRVALVTEYVEGEDLHRCLDGPQRLPLRALVETIGHTAEALHAAWTTPSPFGVGEPMHLVHRDVKPQNIRLGVHGQVKLLDFGIARAANVQRESKTQTHILMGSWPYLAPERLRDDGDREFGSEIDVYALGCTLFEGLAQERLVEGQKLLDLYRVIDEDRGFQSIIDRRLATLEGRFPVAVNVLLSRLLSADPEGRPSAEEVAQTCDALAEELHGAPLRRWARERVWPPPSEQDGPLTDHEITEGVVGATRFRTVTPMGGPPRPPDAVAPPPPPLFPAAEPPKPKSTPAGEPVLRIRTAPPVASREARPAEPTTPLEIPRQLERTPADLLAIAIDSPSEPPPAVVTVAPVLPRAPRVLGLLAGIAVGVCLMLAISTTAAWFWWSSDEPVPPTNTALLPIPDPGIEPAPAPLPPMPVPVPVPTMAPAPAPVVPAPAPEEPTRPPMITGPDEPAPVEPEPIEPEPIEPEPAEPEQPEEPAPADAGAPASLVVSGDAAAVELQGEFGGFRAGTPLIPGTYSVWADFGEGLVGTGQSVVAPAGGQVTVTCVAADKACSVTP